MSWFKVLVIIWCSVSWAFAQDAELFNIAGLPNLNLFPKGCKPTTSMIDASGKFPAGINSGNIVEIGAFDQCISIKEKEKNSQKVIKGQYCLMQFSVPKKNKTSFSLNNQIFNLNPYANKLLLEPQERSAVAIMNPNETAGLVIGWCLPHTCDSHKLEGVFKLIGLEVKPAMGGLLCQTEDSINVKFTESEWGVIGFFIVVLIVMILSTIYDIYLHFAQKRPAHLLLIAFSVKTNSEKLLAISKNPDQLPCLNGIRFISMMWVVQGHRYFVSVVQPTINLIYIKDWVFKDARHMYIINAPLAVDTFFLLSGLLVGYGYCLAKNKGIKFNIPIYYIHRYLRLTPVLGVVVLIHATILPHFGSGPFWPLGITVLKEFCVKHWWAPLVYVQNYYNTQEMCIGQTWYLSVDFQLFILSPIILIPLWKWPKRTLIASGVLVLGSIISSFTVSYYYGLPAASVTLDQIKSEQYMNFYYIATQTRFGPWLMGLMLGYYLFKLKMDRDNLLQHKLHALQIILGWAFALTIMLAALFSSHHLLSEKDYLSNSFWNGLHRHVWSLGLCWVIYACTQGYGGAIDSFLSWPAFQILGRFTYTIYLVHLSTQALMASASRTTYYLNDFYAMYAFWGDLFLSLGIAVILTLAFESPMITIEKVIFSFGKTTKREEPVLPVHQLNNHQTDGAAKDLIEPASEETGETNKAFEAD